VDLSRVAVFAGVVVAAGILGFAMENVIFGARYSKALGGATAGVPLLPVYAAGGAVLAVLVPVVRPLMWPLRAAIYAGSLSGVEYGACRLDIAAGGKRSWRYSDGLDAQGCVDLPHALAWGALGLLVEEVSKLIGW